MLTTAVGALRLWLVRQRLAQLPAVLDDTVPTKQLVSAAAG